MTKEDKIKHRIKCFAEKWLAYLVIEESDKTDHDSDSYLEDLVYECDKYKELLDTGEA